MKKGRKTIYSLLAFIAIAGVSFGDFATSQGVAPEISSAELTDIDTENLEEGVRVNAIHKDKKDEQKDTMTKEDRIKRESEKIAEENKEKQRLAEEKRIEEENICNNIIQIF